MQIIDISLPISNKTLVHPSDDFLKIEPNREFKKDGVRTSKLTIGSHTGTHIDAPRHFLEKGKGVDQIDLEKCMGLAQVIKIPKNVGIIEKEHLEGKINTPRILFKTKNSSLYSKPYSKDFASLGVSGAEYLIERKVVLVGIDYVGIEASGSPGHPVHTKLLGNEVVIVEGFNLSKVTEGKYELRILPLSLTNLDAAPARAILIKN